MDRTQLDLTARCNNQQTTEFEFTLRLPTSSVPVFHHDCHERGTKNLTQDIQIYTIQFTIFICTIVYIYKYIL